MKTTIVHRICVIALLVSCFGLAAFGQTAKAKPTIIILGTYHMANPGKDLNNLQADDVRTEKRQKEIADLVAILKKFKPTRIAVENSGPGASLNERYRSYLNGKLELTANETDQIGFRLAKEMDLKEVSTMAWQGNFDFDKVIASAKLNDQTALTDNFMAAGKTEVARHGEVLKTGSITQMLAYLNTEEHVDYEHRFYLKLAAVGKDADYAGADLISDWYETNLKNYTNITRLVRSPDERILVLIGSGHLKILQHLIEDSGEYDLERLSKYL